MSKSSLFIVAVYEDGERLDYEYGNLKHAREHFNLEEKAYLLEYNNGNYFFMDCK